MAGVILGEWTHRRADAGGGRAVAADVARGSPALAWTWRPDHAGHVDQVRVALGTIFVAAMTPREPEAPGWEHAVIHALDARSGARIARRTLPDPVPVAALVVDREVVHVLATRKGEPIYWYALDAATLAPLHRRVVALDRDGRAEDVLDAWALPDGGLWLELEGPGGRAYASVPTGDGIGVSQTHEEDVAGADAASPPRDACTGERALFAPVGGALSEGGSSSPPALWRLEPRVADAPGRAQAPAARDAWMRAELAGPRAREHAIAADGAVYAAVVAQDAERSDRVLVQAYAVDGASSVVRWRTGVAKLPLRETRAEAAKVVRRPNGELLLQCVAVDGRAASELVCARGEGELDVFPLGNGKRPLLDLALGDVVVAHHESKGGRVNVAAFEIDRATRLLGRRGSVRWTVETPDLGGATTVYAGAGVVLVRGAQALAAIRA